MAGIYIHIPFCKTKCIYCDFYSQTDTALKRKYIQAVCRELELRKDYIGGETVHTIYFGGGTPSQLDFSDFEIIFEHIYKNYSVSSNAEITLEANPDDMDDSFFRDLDNLPFNRISIGIQSFNDDELRFLNRRHTATQAVDAVKSAQDSGFSNISIDLMYGLPSQSLDSWKATLQTAVSLNVWHISSYHLIYEEGTKLNTLLKKGKIIPSDEELSVDMFSEMRQILSENGFLHYEISNFAKEGFLSRHNSSYWKGEKYLGIGTAAHSFDGESRSHNVSSIHKYIDGIFSGILPITEETLSPSEKYNDFILTGMRTMWGIDLEILERNFGHDMYDYCLKNAARHLKHKTVITENNRLMLTPQGLLISDGIMSDLMYIN